MTLTTILSAVVTFVGDILPDWSYYVIAVVVAGLAMWLLRKLIFKR